MSYLSIITPRMIPGFTWGLFPPSHSLSAPQFPCKVPVVLWGGPGPTGKSGYLASYWACSQGPWWRGLIQLESSISCSPIHLKFQVPLPRETKLWAGRTVSLRAGGTDPLGSCWLCTEGWNKELEAPPWPWGWAQVSRSSPREGVGKGLGEADLSA